MWILPTNYPLSSLFVQDMVESKEDLTLPGLNIESSLFWRSKPSPLRTWLTRWKTGSYLPHLYTRILKPSHRTCFEEKLASSLADILVNLLVQQESDSEQMTQDTCGRTSGDTSKQLDLLDASLKTLKVTSRLDSPASSATWKKMAIKARGEYSQRVKLAHHTRESASTSWATPNTMDYLPQRSEEALVRQATTQRKGRTRPANLREQVNPKAVAIYQTNWPTPSAHEARLGYQDRSDPTKKGTQESLTTVIVNKAGGRSVCTGHLNPDWVEWLMGVPTGWTELGSWETESYQQQPPKRG